MFVRNAEKLTHHNIYTCNEKLGEFLIKEGFPLFGRDGKKMKFIKTARLEKVLKHLPLRMKFTRKVGF